jgi:hypothetical protein
VRYIEVNKHFWYLETVYCIVVYIYYWIGKLNLDERLVKSKLLFFAIQVHGPQVKNGCFGGF